MKNEIIADLGSNYRAEDSTILDKILSDVTNQALFISNRETTTGIEFEIKEAVKTIYLRRGTEDVISLGESGRNASYTDALKKLRTDLIKICRRSIIKESNKDKTSKWNIH
jgi:hypothetical protein